MKANDKIKYKTREEWLLAATSLMRPLFEKQGYTVPEVRVACGWPSRGGKSGKVLGEAWCKTAASDKIPQIFITPRLDKTCGPQDVMSVLIHELCHATVGNENKHNKVFGKCARAVGLEGKLTATTACADLMQTFTKFMERLGEFPHARLNPMKAPTKKQSTRLIKCECPATGYNCRVTRKWLEEFGAPLSPKTGKAMIYEVPDGMDFDGEDGDE